MQKFFSLVLALTAATTLAFAAQQQATQNVDCGGTAKITATPQTGYHFVQWNDGNQDNPRTITNISQDLTFTATFAINTYTIRFLNGETELQSGTVEYGQTPSYTGATPTKASTAQFSYTFTGWSPAIAEATQDQDYVAQFSENLRSYLIIFKDHDGTVLKSTEVAYGTVPTCDAPTREADAQYTYTFNGWDVTPVAVVGEATYTATYTQTLRKYTITFNNWNGTELQSTEVAYGATPVYEGATPTRAADDQYTYTFDGWGEEIVAVTGEKTYTAHFSTTTNKYTITFYDEDGTTELWHGDFAYGADPVYGGATPTKAADDQYTYTFAGWTPALAPVNGTASYTATFNAIPKTYFTISESISPDAGAGHIEGVGSYEENTVVTLTAESDDACYVFDKWADNDSTNPSRTITVTGNATYTAIFKKIQYTVTVNYDDAQGTVTIETIE